MPYSFDPKETRATFAYGSYGGDVFRLALDLAPAGTSWHAVANEGDAVRDIAAVIGRRLGLPVEAVPQETYGPLGPIFAIDQPSSSTHTREVLGPRTG
jgi:hypothetical protein